MRISDWSSDVCSSDLRPSTARIARPASNSVASTAAARSSFEIPSIAPSSGERFERRFVIGLIADFGNEFGVQHAVVDIQHDHRTRGQAGQRAIRSEEHTSELQSLMRISYAVFCLKKKQQNGRLLRMILAQ